jgi:hypothetical protein
MLWTGWTAVLGLVPPRRGWSVLRGGLGGPDSGQHVRFGVGESRGSGDDHWVRDLCVHVAVAVQPVTTTHLHTPTVVFSTSYAPPCPQTAPQTPRRDVSVGVDQLANRRDLPAQLVVAGGLPGDLVARMEDRRVVAVAELGADPEQ